MLDLETLALSPKAVVTQIGFALFDLEPSSGAIGGIIERGCFFLNPEDQINNFGREVNWSTVAWWLTQEEAARKQMAELGEFTRAVLEKFNIIFSSDIKNVWGNGSHFDIPIMESLLQDFGFKTPWHYRAPKDCRTLAMLVPEDKKDLVQVKNPIKHSAMHDAIAQAKWMQNCYALVMGKEIPHANG